MPQTSWAAGPLQFTDEQLEDKVKAKGYGFLLIKETADLFRREAEKKYGEIMNERGSKEEKNRADCLEKQRWLYRQDLLIDEFACVNATSTIPTNMRNRLQSEMLEGGVIYVRDIRRPLLGLLSSNVFTGFSEEVYSLEQVAEVWSEVDILITQQRPTHISKERVVINPNDRRGHLFTLNFKIMLASAVVMFDNYEAVLSKYLFDEEMRKSFRYMDGRYRDVSQELITLWDRVESGDLLGHLSQAVSYYDVIGEVSKGSKGDHLIDDEAMKMERNLDRVIRNSIAYRYTNESPEKLAQRRGLSLWWNKSVDSFKSWWRDRAHNLSQLFGNLAGQGQCRKGVMYTAYHGKQQALDELSGELRVGDILLEKTPFRSTDKYIPGHYGHVAIWTGSKTELQAYGIWEQLPALHREAVKFHNYPESPTFQESVEAGARIIEALRSGVEFHTLEHFLDIDDLGVIRPQTCDGGSESNDPNSSGCHTSAEIRRALINSFQQLGKRYDFAFDAFTKDKIVCSELAYQAYDHVEFEISPSLGSMASISPDQVAFKADGLKEGEGLHDPFYPALLFHNGTRVRGEQKFLTQVFNKLLEATDESYRWVHKNTPSKALARCF
ncbi:MAG: YiiX/YebB-like N1pC/P60 family cysteine hydrolase [Candidatus Sedimenticola sp. (ex Thyasira tokunagai)]